MPLPGEWNEVVAQAQPDRNGSGRREEGLTGRVEKGDMEKQWPGSYAHAKCALMSRKSSLPVEPWQGSLSTSKPQYFVPAFPVLTDLASRIITALFYMRVHARAHVRIHTHLPLIS